MSEDLVAFKDSNGRIGLLEAPCLHRRASLFWGRNEEGGIRCSYHGWKYDIHGNCIDMPNDPEGDTLKNKVKAVAYPCVERGGLVWTYMGPLNLQPEIPDMEWLNVPDDRKIVTKRQQETNWTMAVEGGIDSSHASFLHSRLPGVGTDPRQDGVPIAALPQFLMADRHPHFSVKPTDCGLAIAARRNADQSTYYWRITQFLMPFYSMIAGPIEHGSSINGHAWVPIDDENSWVFTLTWNADGPITDEEKAFQLGGGGIHARSDGNFRALRNKDNNYLIDRNIQHNETYTGIDGIGEQDMSVQESMGRIVDRSLERLGTSDAGIIAFRRLMIRQARELQQGKEPTAPYNGSLYRVRPASALLGHGIEFDQGAASELVARP
jgi:phenylpropionate dioxygenase-like ring-hydroxylating dioxygenase large terminal subunit